MLVVLIRMNLSVMMGVSNGTQAFLGKLKNFEIENCNESSKAQDGMTAHGRAHHFSAVDGRRPSRLISLNGGPLLSASVHSHYGPSAAGGSDSKRMFNGGVQRMTKPSAAMNG